MTDPSIERFRRVVESAYLELDSRRTEVNDLKDQVNDWKGFAEEAHAETVV